MMIRPILILAALLLPGFDLQAQTVTDPGWTLNSAGTAYAAQSLCIAAATALPSPKPGTSATQKCADTTTITVSTPLPAASAAGAYLTGPTATGALTDAAGTAWTLNAGVVYDQPVTAAAPAKAGYSLGVGALLWFGGKIHQQNPACLWWYWSGTTWTSESAPSGAPSCAGVSASGTVVTFDGQGIIDASLTTWRLQNGVVYVQALNAAAAAPAGYSANVIALAYVGGKIYQENASCQWYVWTATATPPWGTSPVAAPAAGPVCSAPSSSSSGGSSSSGSSSSGSSSSSSSGAHPVAFGVRASGNKLVSTLNAAPVTLIGGVISGCETNFAPVRCTVIANEPVSYWSTTWKTQHAGTNTARIHLDTCSYLNLSCAGGCSASGDCSKSPNVGTAAAVQKTVANMTAAGLYVILDELQDAPAGQQSIGEPGFAGASNSPNFWKALADLYKNQPNVIFDIFNEPFGENVYADWATKDVPIVANGGIYVPFCQQNNSNANAMQCHAGVSYMVEGELQLLNVVRGEGASNLVLLSPTGWAGEIENWLASYNVNGNPDPLKNVGAAQHAYGYNSGLAPIKAVQAAGYPVVETEFEGSTVGNIGLQNATNLGLSLIGCCSNAWDGVSIQLVSW